MLKNLYHATNTGGYSFNHRGSWKHLHSYNPVSPIRNLRNAVLPKTPWLHPSLPALDKRSLHTTYQHTWWGPIPLL